MTNKRKELKRFYILVDLIAIVLSYLSVWYLYIYRRIEIGALPFRFYLYSMPIIVLVYLIMNAIFGLYGQREYENKAFVFARLVEANTVGLIFILAALFIGGKNPWFYNFSRILLVASGILNIFIESIFRFVIRLILSRLRKKGFNQKHILLVGYSDACFKFIDRVKRNPGWGYNIFGIVDDNHKIGTEYRNVKVIGDLNHLKSIIEDNSFDEVEITLALNEYDKLRDVVFVSEKAGVHTKFVPDYGTVIPTNPVSDDFDGLPVINIRAVPLQGLFNRFIKRTIDIIGSIVGIIIFSPIMLIIAIAIKLTDNGKVIFKQERVGRHNKTFTMYKFRSMKNQTTEQSDTKWTIPDDDRVTKVGKIIRRTSLDEVPQFFNVLKGQMSLVGPRPERVKYVDQFKDTIPRYMIKHQVRPGMTGWAQINGLRGDTDIDRRIQYDLWYIENWTLALDIRILLLTIFKGFINENAY